MAETDTSTGFRETADGGREVVRPQSRRVDDALRAAHGRRKARRSRPRAKLESAHHSIELREKA